MCKPAHSSTLLDMKDIGAVYCTKHRMKFLLGKLASCLLVFYIRFRITWITITWITTVTMEVSTAAAAWKRTGWWYTPWKFFWSKPVATRRWPWRLRQHTIFIFWCKTVLEANLAYMQSQWMQNFLGGMHCTLSRRLQPTVHQLFVILVPYQTINPGYATAYSMLNTDWNVISTCLNSVCNDYSQQCSWYTAWTTSTVKISLHTTAKSTLVWQIGS